MKIKYLFSLVILVISCSKSSTTSTTNNGFVGEYNWLYSTGGITGTTTNPVNTGNTKKLVITSDSLFTYQNNILTRATAYNSVMKKSIIYNSTATIFVYSDNSYDQIPNVKTDTLIMVDDCIDCFTSFYKKTK